MLTCFESPIFKRYQIFKDEVVATFTATAPSPQRDFYHLQVLKGKIRRIMGKSVLRFCDSVTKGQLDFLPRMPPSIIKRIVGFVNAEDIVNLQRSCKSICEVCNSDDVWRGVYCRYHKESPNDVIEELAGTYGWKRVFFTSKLKLQLQIRRLRLERGQPAGDEAANDMVNASMKLPSSGIHSLSTHKKPA
ncbi:F-box only protein 36 [Taenia crassiceps]|uniref:F-box only protein 36 n=1 Tax=Taenia crassiceps TaxID=6207 RepID=A0ABR4QND2_9CEST